MASDIATYLKFANVQMAAEALFTPKNVVPGATYSGAVLPAVLATGNERSGKFSDAQATEFAANWMVVEHISDTPTGFSGTLFKYTGETNAAKGLTNGELVMSFRSTEFLDDSARDNQATNSMEIKPYGWAFGQIADMENWYAQLQADPSKLQGKAFSVTGYSLGGYLATVCASRRHAAAKYSKRSICYKNNSCLRTIYKRCSPKT